MFPTPRSTNQTTFFFFFSLAQNSHLFFLFAIHDHSYGPYKLLSSSQLDSWCALWVKYNAHNVLRSSDCSHCDQICRVESLSGHLPVQHKRSLFPLSADTGNWPSTPRRLHSEPRKSRKVFPWETHVMWPVLLYTLLWSNGCGMLPVRLASPAAE